MTIKMSYSAARYYYSRLIEIEKSFATGKRIDKEMPMRHFY
jgi:hypothetical protein